MLRDAQGWSARLHRASAGALYLHVPFCAQKCGYCDFASWATRRDDTVIASYMRALERLVMQTAEAGLLAGCATAYVGGGTPTLAGDSLAHLVQSVTGTCQELCECSCEANPDSLGDELLAQLVDAGCTRLSIGVQSLDELLPEQATLEKPKFSGKVEEGIRTCDFDSFTIDLPAAWVASEENGKEYYYDQVEDAAYMLNSVKDSNCLSPDEIIERHVKALEGKAPEEIVLPSDEITDKNGNVLTLGQISYTENGAASVLQLVICRAHDSFMTFKGTCPDASKRQQLLDSLDAAARTVAFDPVMESISGKKYNVEAENCVIDLKSDKTFRITYDRNDKATVTRKGNNVRVAANYTDTAVCHAACSMCCIKVGSAVDR